MENGPRVARFHWGSEELAVLSMPLDTEGGLGALTEAERHIVRLVAAGCANAEIAARRGTATRTVANQLASVFKKLGVRSRTELAHRLRA